MGFPPIGIMSLSSVLKRAGHECVMFDQANPRHPNGVIVDEIRREQTGSDRTELSEHDELSLRQDLRAPDSRRRCARCKLAFGGVFATLNASWSSASAPKSISSAAATANN